VQRASVRGAESLRRVRRHSLFSWRGSSGVRAEGSRREVYEKRGS
jgi:hypothetical protein